MAKRRLKKNDAREMKVKRVSKKDQERMKEKEAQYNAMNKVSMGMDAVEVRRVPVGKWHPCVSVQHTQYDIQINCTWRFQYE